jgi:class 3 adenylate cyclase
MSKMLTCLVIDIVNFTKICATDSEFAKYVQTILFDNTAGLIKRTCSPKGQLASTPGDAQLYLFNLPIDTVHAAIDLLAEIRKHNAKNIKKEFLVHIAITFGEVNKTNNTIWTGAAINNAFKLAKTVLPNYILTDQMVYQNLKSYPIDFRLLTMDEPTQDYQEPIYSVRTNENINGGLTRRIDDLNIKIESLVNRVGYADGNK